MTKLRFRRTSPSLHLVMLLVIWGISFIGYITIIWSGELRGYTPSKAVAMRDMILLVPLLVLFFWLTRRQRFRGEMSILTCALLLFAAGMVIQYRLFSDPEYGARGAERYRAREAKSQTVRLLNIKTGYDQEKLKFMLGGNTEVPDKPGNLAVAPRERTLTDVLISVNTFIPLLAFAALVVGFLIFKNDKLLNWLQGHSMLIGLVTLLPFAILVLGFSEEGKFLGQTTPWEPVKIIFLVSFAGVLSTAYRHLGRTRWGIPPFRYLLPFLAIAAMPVVPFFALSDFGQMLVFFGVYILLYIIAVRRKTQLLYGLVLVAILFCIFFGVTRAKSGFGLPSRVHFRFYMWAHLWEPPSPDTWWWKKDYEKYIRVMGLTAGSGDPQEIKQRNIEAWSDKVLQQSEGLFGIHEGGLIGKSLGLGFPETVPISDSDFIYAALSEETGLIGSLIVIIGIASFVLGGTSISIGSHDMFTKLVATGLTAFIGFQSLVNIGGVLRVLPMTGITLPFVSHGGWSLVTSFAMLGILLAISHRTAVAHQSSTALSANEKN